MRENKNHTKAFRVGTFIVSFWSSANTDAKQILKSTSRRAAHNLLLIMYMHQSLKCFCW